MQWWNSQTTFKSLAAEKITAVSLKLNMCVWQMLSRFLIFSLYFFIFFPFCSSFYHCSGAAFGHQWLWSSSFASSFPTVFACCLVLAGCGLWGNNSSSFKTAAVGNRNIQTTSLSTNQTNVHRMFTLIQTTKRKVISFLCPSVWM